MPDGRRAEQEPSITSVAGIGKAPKLPNGRTGPRIPDVMREAGRTGQTEHGANLKPGRASVATGNSRNGSAVQGKESMQKPDRAPPYTTKSVVRKGRVEVCPRAAWARAEASASRFNRFLSRGAQPLRASQQKGGRQKAKADPERGRGKRGGASTMGLPQPSRA